MASVSIDKLIFVLPVPITAFNQIVETDIKINATDTTRTTGIAANEKASSCP